MEPDTEQKVMANGTGLEPAGETRGDVLDNSVQQLLGALDRLEPKLKKRQNDLQFLRGLLRSSDFNVLMKTHKKLSNATADNSAPPKCFNAITLSHMVLYDVEQDSSRGSQELFELLSKPHIHSVLNVHDQIANKDYPVRPIPIDEHIGASRFETVRIDKKRNPLGATVRQDNAGNILISRVLHGSVADRSKQLHTGDVIHEINGQTLRGKTIDDVADMMQQLTGIVVFKKSSSLQEHHQPQKRSNTPTYLKALFSYSPVGDDKQPCSEAGLEFRMGDILSAVNRDDKLWWQAAHFDSRERVGLIPSTLVRESTVFEQTNRKKKSKGRKADYSPTQEYSGTEVLAYEEVVRIGPQLDKPRPIVVVAPKGGHFNIKSLINELTTCDPDRFNKAVTHTTRSRGPNLEEGHAPHIVTKGVFEEFIRDKKVVEYIKIGSHYYGVCSSSVVETRRQKKVCLLHIDPRSLKLVRTQELMPFVVCIKPSTEQWIRDNWIRTRKITEAGYQELLQDHERLETYRHLFDASVTYESERQARDEIQRLSDNWLQEDSWVPATWTR